MVSNKKGFTLVEVLTVIVILGILSTIGIVTVVNIRKNQAVKFDQTQRELFKETAKTYFSDHKSQLPMINNQENRVYLVDLINENYIDSLLDYNKKSYQKDKSYVSVKKVASRYVYTVNLLKEGETGDDYIVSEDKNPIDINFDNYQNKDGKMNATTNNGETKHYTNKTAKVDIEIEVQDEIGIAAFNYSIYKNGKKVYTSEYIEPNGTRAKDTIILDLNEYGDGEYKIGVEVYDMKDHYKSGKSDKIVIDRVPPTCTVSGGNELWINKKSSVQYRTIEAKCTDSGSGCKSSKLSKKYEKDINTTEAGAAGDKEGGSVSDNAGNVTKCSANQIVKIDKTAPTVTLAIASQNASYNTISANVTVNIYDNNTTKYELSKSNYSTKTYEQMTTVGSNGNNVINMAVSDSYDGSTKTIYVTVKDIAGNETKEKITYTIYKNCTNTVANRNPTYGACSANCGSGTRLKTQVMKDAYLGTTCSSIETTVSCGTLPDCCSRVTYQDGSVCTVACNGGTYNRLAYSAYNGGRCPNQDLSSGGSACNSQDCCSSVTLSSCSTSCGVGVKKATSNYDGRSCPKKNTSCKDRTCSKSTCYVGNTLYSVNVHWPYNAGTVGYGDCPNDKEAYWFYCSDKKGKLWTNLKRNTYYSGHDQWACKSNNLKDKTGKTVTISGKKYKVINDSNNFWKDCSNSCYYGTCT